MTARRRAGRWAAVAAAAMLVGPAPAGAWDGERAPNDPLYDIAEEQPATHSFDEEQWFMYSFIPRSTPFARDPEGAAGMSIDRAWQRYGAGRPDVRIAYLEGGVNWRTENARRELAPRAYLNAGELPRPRGRVEPRRERGRPVQRRRLRGRPAASARRCTGRSPPRTLIVAFSDGVDDDGNGYVDDISGWNFSRGNNDPQTEDSAYTHANNQMMRAAGEGDNGFARRRHLPALHGHPGQGRRRGAGPHRPAGAGDLLRRRLRRVGGRRRRRRARLLAPDGAGAPVRVGQGRRRRRGLERLQLGRSPGGHVLAARVAGQRRRRRHHRASPRAATDWASRAASGTARTTRASARTASSRCPTGAGRRRSRRRPRAGSRR